MAVVSLPSFDLGSSNTSVAMLNFVTRVTPFNNIDKADMGKT